MKEAEFWGQIRPYFQWPWFVRRIEDASGNLGTYDTFLAHPNLGQAWLELKVAEPDAKPNLRKGQPAFGRGLYDAGVACGYLVGSPSGKVRLIGPLTTGDDWRDHLVAEWPHLDVSAVVFELFYPRHATRELFRKAG